MQLSSVSRSRLVSRPRSPICAPLTIFDRDEPKAFFSVNRDDPRLIGNYDLNVCTANIPRKLTLWVYCESLIEAEMVMLLFLWLQWKVNVEIGYAVGISPAVHSRIITFANIANRNPRRHIVEGYQSAIGDIK